MSDQLDQIGLQETTLREFFVSADLYISNVAGAALRKPVSSAQRKKLDKRDSSSALAEENKLKEKSSWLTPTRGLSGVGQWRSAKCRLTEEGERCLLNIYVDDSILYQTVYIHLLHQTDIRHADSSLFFRKDCLAIYCIDGQRWTSAYASEPIYLQFVNSETCVTWLTLLKSYAIPEIYGRWFFPSDGGSYRMWRQVELKIIQGRNLGATKAVEVGRAFSTDIEPNAEIDIVDMDVSCEIHLSDLLCGRTTVKKGIGSPDWHEQFLFPDLPPFENLDILVWREKRLFKPVILGSVRIPLTNFRRGETVEGWFPVLQSGSFQNDVQVGELRLKIRIDEEIVLPNSAYSGLLKTLHSRNFLDWICDFENKLNLKTASTQLMSIAIARDVLVEQVQVFASREVENSSSSHRTLFRGNSILTKVMESCMALYGKAFLEASIGNVLRRLCAEKISIEVDPARSGKNSKDLERNVEQLIYWCQEFWNQIYSTRAECPQEMRRLFGTIRQLVERRCRTEQAPAELQEELPLQSVSAFCFLRFIVPAILNPHLFGLCPGLPSVAIQRSLKLIAKVIQSLANLNASVQKESFMAGIREFLRETLPAMKDYILVVSAPDSFSSAQHGGLDRHDRLNIAHSLRQRALTMPMLDRESIPLLPHVLDIPRHLATITSAVIRHSRDFRARPKVYGSNDKFLEELCLQSLAVEEQALQRVSQLATRLTSGPKSASINSSPSKSSLDRFLPSPLSATAGSQRRPRNPGRPSTAPSPSESSSRRNLFVEGSTVERPRMFSRTTASQQVEQDMHMYPNHLKSPSTDSIQGFVTAEPVPETLDDATKRKRNIFRGILRR
ncbi:Rho GTPase activation protein [Crucibulum laeve]|uniref:Rho GTPase activation protein n=1 Tax=Crucibulum laeve TaxID=68775 RepID=A0A5C3M9M6_9AGAR|nr:Rho GTPase activation protein [Crucibulum laeve]